MVADYSIRNASREGTTGNNGLEVHRRDLLLAAGTTLTLGFDAVTNAKAATGSGNAKIDAHTHFAPLKFLEFAELSPLSEGAAKRNIDAFRTGIRASGYVEGQNIKMETRFADGTIARMPDLVAELVTLKPAVLV